MLREDIRYMGPIRRKDVYIAQNMVQVFMIQNVSKHQIYVIQLMIIFQQKMKILLLLIEIVLKIIQDIIIISTIKIQIYTKNVIFLVCNAMIILIVYPINVTEKKVISQ